MSWLARSIANSLKLENDDAFAHSPANNTDTDATESQSDHNENRSPAGTARGVKEDLSELTKSFSRQLWGVASFLAPPPQEQQVQEEKQPQTPDRHQPSNQLPDPGGVEEDIIEGIRSDFAEISGKFRSGFSKLSSNIAVSDFTKIASNFLQFGSEMEPVDAVGVTDEVLLFARNIAMHPETWLDFPVNDEEDFDDFDMSDVQQEHALAVERLAPSLASLRMELCPGHMSDSSFWKIYFVLLHPRLNKEDAELLSTPQIVEARVKLAHELQNRGKAKPEPDHSVTSISGSDKIAGSGTSYSNETAELPHLKCSSEPSGKTSEMVPLKTSAIEATSCTTAAEFETEKHPGQSTEMQAIDKSIVKEQLMVSAEHQDPVSGPSAKVVDEKVEDDGDDWLKEEGSEMVGVSGSTVPLGNDDDVSFSDLEEEDDDVPTSFKKATSGSDSSTKDSRDWVQLSRISTDSVKDVNPAGAKQATKPESKESNDWLDFDDIDEL